jgi:hypothetical protein
MAHKKTEPTDKQETRKTVHCTMSNVPIIAGTLQTDPRSGGVKKSSGVKVLPIVDEGEKKIGITFA